MAIRGLKALLLDALGTLVELPPPAPALQEELAARFGVAVTLGEAERAIVAEIAYYRARFDDAVDAESLRALRRACAEVLRDALPESAALTAASLDDVVELLLAALRFRAYDDAGPTILAARERGLRVVVASNWDVGLPDVLEHVGLAPLIDGIVTSASVGARKPAAAVFEAALHVAGVEPSAALHVGDSLTEDIVGARAAGVKAVLISRGGAIEPDGVPVLRSLSQLRTLI